MKFIKISSQFKGYLYFDDLPKDMNGLVYYNYISDIIFIRTSIHDFGGYRFDILERVEFPNCILLGVLK